MRSLLAVLVMLTLAACGGGSGGGGVVANSFRVDSDADGIPDWVEAVLGSDKNDANSPIAGGAADTNSQTGPAGDGIPDGLEQYLINLGAVAPVTAATDSDGDGIADYFEIWNGSQPNDAASPLATGALAADTNASTGPNGDRVSDAFERLALDRGAVGPVTTMTDTDNDGLPDYIEMRLVTDPLNGNSPVPNGGADTDNDGMTDAVESILLSLGAPAPVTRLSDTDADGVPDWVEILTGTHPADKSDPGDFKHIDVDQDGVPDYFEVLRGSDPIDSKSPSVDGSLDTNDATGPSGDSIGDALEKSLIAGGATQPVTARTDTDSDGVPDYYEVLAGYSPFDPSSPLAGGGSDAVTATGPPLDGISDALEAILASAGAAAPVHASTDSDGDGIPDYAEVWAGSDAADANDPLANGSGDTNDTTGPGGDSISDAVEQHLIARTSSTVITATTDSDGDRIPDVIELRTGTDPAGALSPGFGNAADSDGDGVANYLEALLGHDPFDADSPVAGGASDTNNATGPSDDGMSDALESVIQELSSASSPVGPSTDSDGDGVPDMAEIRFVYDSQSANSPITNGAADTNDATGPADGLTDAVEFLVLQGGLAVAPITTRTDGDADGVPDHTELRFGSSMFSVNEPVVSGGQDTNDATGPSGDRISDALEYVLSRLGATTPVTASTDTDSDVAPDYYEVWGGGDPTSATSPAAGGSSDSDGDRVADSVEAVLAGLGFKGSVNARTDYDGDGIPDSYEVRAGTNALDATLPLATGGAAADTNDLTGPSSDGVSDALESLLITQGATPPIYTATDTDEDGLPDAFEVFEGTDPLNFSSPTVNGYRDDNATTGPAGDGLTDAFEAWIIAHASPPPASVTTSTDSDGDGIPDYLEIDNGTDPFSSSSKPPSGAVPSVTALSVTGTLAAGQVLTGGYAYSDADGNPEGQSVYSWLRDGAVIAGADQSSYRLTDADSTKVITFRVTPVSMVGIPNTGTMATKAVGPVAPLPFGLGGPAGVGTTDGTSALEMWLRSDRGTSTLTDGAELRAWNDLSGNNVTADNNEPGTKPRLDLTAGPRGLPTVRFAPKISTVQFPRPVSDDMTFYVLFKTAVSSSHANWWDAPALIGGAAIGTPPQNDYGLVVNDGRLAFGARNAGAGVQSTNRYNDGVTHIAAVTREMSSGAVGLFVDGQQDGAGTLSTSSLAASATVRLGRHFSGTGQLTGDITEFIAYSAVHGVVQRRLVENYLSARYNVSIAGDLYSLDATHRFELAGIGRVSATDLVASSESHDIVKVSSPTASSNGDFLLWAHDGGAAHTKSNDVPAGYTERMTRVWGYELTDGGAGDGVGQVTVTFRLAGLGLSTTATDYALLFDSDASFGNATAIGGGTYNGAASTITFTGVSWPTSPRTGYFALAVKQ